MSYKLGSLFDGSGTCPLTATLCGIEPVWASEIEPYPVRVTTARFPAMRHLGDITKIDGAAIPPVDIITFGSPCQDMSIAGRRAGLQDGERSVLFYEAIRIIREMRRATNGKYPRFAVWENVPGAFSSNKGEDFRCVIEAFLSLAEGRLPTAVPMPANGRWPRAGVAMDNGFSLAWRTLDARYWGVAQRRRRIYLVADFAGGSAGEVLFEREGLRRDHPARGAAQEGITTDAARGAGGSGGSGCLTPWDTQTTRLYDPRGIAPTLAAREHSGQNLQGVVYPAGPVPSLCARADSSPCLDRGQPFVAHDARGNGDGAVAAAITGDHESRITDYTNLVVGSFSGGQGEMAGSIGYAENIAPSLKAAGSGSNSVPDVVYALQGNGIDRADTAGCNGAGVKEDTSYTLNTVDRHGVAYASYQDVTGPLMANSHPGSYSGQDAYSDMLVTQPTVFRQMSSDRIAEADGTASTLTACCHKQSKSLCVSRGGALRKWIVRRLTPLECCRLQGFPDWWEDGVEGSDSARYKMWGNGMALPCVLYVMQGIKEALVNGG